MTETNEIAAALAAFQAEAPTVPKSKTANTGTYSYSYADLADVCEVAMPILAKHGLAFTALPKATERGFILRGVLLHKSGQRVKGELPVTGSTPQQIGSSLTYARRYLFGCLTGIVTDADDDGALASAKPKRPQRVKKAPEDDPFYDQPPRAAGDRQISTDQLKLVGTLMSKRGLTEREDALDYVEATIGRRVDSRNDLTRAEASKLIDALQALPEGATA